MNIKLVDTTIRDGNHSVNNKFTLEDIKDIVQVLNKCNVDYIEVGYGYGLGSNKNNNYPTDREIIKTAIANSKSSKIAILVLPTKCSINKFKEILDLDLGLIRIGVQADNVSPSQPYINLAKEKGYNVGGFLMMASKFNKKTILEQTKLLESYGANNITITDSAGAMTYHEMQNKFMYLAKNSQIDLGFHTHDNLGLAIGNSMQAINISISNNKEKLYIDTALSGLGAGAGNTKTETLIALLKKSEISSKYNFSKAIEGINLLNKILSKYKIQIKNNHNSLIVGYYGIYSAFERNINEISKKYNINPVLLTEKVAKENLVPGQEYIIEQIAKYIKKKIN